MPEYQLNRVSKMDLIVKYFMTHHILQQYTVSYVEMTALFYWMTPRILAQLHLIHGELTEEKPVPE